MKKFKVEKNGYDKNDVDDYIFKLNEDYESKFREQKMRISDLKAELESTKQQLESFKQKNSSISEALVVAIQTAKQIESSSKNIYELEIKRVRSLYDKWKAFLEELMKKYPELRAKYDTKLLLEVFSNDIDRILKQNKESMEQKEAVGVTEAVNPDTIGLRVLISKMNNISKTSQQSVLQKGDVPIIRNEKPSDETMAKHQIDMMTNEEMQRLGKDSYGSKTCGR